VVGEDRDVALHNWSGNIRYSTQRRAEPSSIEELQSLVAAHDRIRPHGSGHSFNRIADTAGVQVDVRKLPLPLEIEDETHAALPAGARYGEVAAALHERGLALANLGSLPHISVAGACATATHGSGRGNGCLATSVTGVEFVRADGELVRWSEDDPEFDGAVVHLGALGIVTRLTLAVEPTYEIAQDVWADAPLDRVLEHYDDITSAAYSVSLFTGFENRERIDHLWFKRRTPDPIDAGEWGARPADADVHPIAGQDARAATPQQGIPGPWHERLPHFRASFTPSSGDEQQSEYFVPIEAGPAAIAAVMRLDLAAVVQVAEFRTIAADDLWLSPFHDRPTAALHFTWHNDDEAVRHAVGLVEDALAPYDPRAHWGKVFRMAAADVRGHYPRLAEFRDLVDACDPNRKFGNDFLETYVY
jgi:xylitol oxidase